MPEAEVSLKYRSFPVAVAQRALGVMLPVYLIFLTWSVLCILLALCDGRIQAGPTWLLIAGEFALAGLAAVIMFLLSDQTIFMTREGISLPFVVSPCLGLRAQRAWKTLSGVRFTPQGARLTLSFRTGPPARIDLQRLRKKDVERLIVAVDVWAGGCDAFPALLEARAYLEPGNHALQAPSYTQVWEDELARHFGATNFIPLEPGHTLRDGTYEVERQLAFGGLSAIYLVRDQMKHRYVLKEAVVPPGGNDALKEKAQQMLDREAFLLARLQHPHIARVLDSFVESERHYLLMEYLRGSDLRKLVKEYGPQAESDVLDWARQLADTLNYMHTQDPPVIHRDLSPDNLILKEDGQIAIIDFGAANQFVGTATGTMIGKQAYIAPEQLRGKAEPKSDIYAFGCTIYFLLTGSDPQALSVSHPREHQPAVSLQLDQLVARCTADEPADRPASSELLAALLAVPRNNS